ncbi:helix-turn-helix domain-containing protein [Nonomuraea endophytica]|uniref:AraC-like DNA-binding protein n=1 Tax=Nonomuraea endophytica TaxID=714136 RepID=A0A7W8EH21_9ACTN|nr:AraC family transcriptional regulator [Nonomuraea endophytica]MBB5079088.1 AraC-like DNA-binding protein [Nonomuraea endophytica]
MTSGDGTAPYFAVHEGYALYRGPVSDSVAHRHAAFQVAIAVEGEVSMLDAGRTRHRAAALVVPPMVWHRILAVENLLTFFVEPHCAFADRLRARHGAGITAAADLRGLREQDVRGGGAHPSGDLDPRLQAAMRTLSGQNAPRAPGSMPALAAEVGLSPQRLRALARLQLGMPLSRWRIWVRLRRAAEAMRAGQSPADAAIAGGFADQAHFTRRLREMMGLTPAAVAPLLRRSAAPGDVHGDGARDR